MKVIKTILSVFAWLFVAVILFICVNLVIGCVKYRWVWNYTKILDEKNWGETINQVSINPLSWLWLFYNQQNINIDDPEALNMFQQVDNALIGNPWVDDGAQDAELGVLDDSNDSMFDLEWADSVDTQENTIWEEKTQGVTNPYDPEFEDEFNSFFAWN